MSVTAIATDRSGDRITAPLLVVSDAIAAILLAADLVVVCVSVLARFLFNAPVEWSDDVARGLMVGSSFFGAASALARSENLGVAFFVDMLPPGVRRIVDAVSVILSNHDPRLPIAFVGHGGVGTLLKCHLSGVPIARTFDQPGGGGNLFAFTLDDRRLTSNWTTMEHWQP